MWEQWLSVRFIRSLGKNPAYLWQSIAVKIIRGILFEVGRRYNSVRRWFETGLNGGVIVPGD
jgi:hypothetical protein